MTYTLNLDWENVQNVVVQALREDYDNLDKTSKALMTKSTPLLPIEVEDLGYELEVKKALRTVINYYSKPQDWIDE